MYSEKDIKEAPDRISSIRRVHSTIPRKATGHGNLAFMARRAATLLVFLLLPHAAWSHGSVTAEEDLCLIRIGYMTAHFKIFLPRERGHQEFCEDLPAGGEAVFVMEYIHEDLGKVPLDFRIIRDVTGMGRFANVDDVAGIADIEAATVYHYTGAAVPDVFTALHDFDEEGGYLGIVTAARPDIGQVYTAVFPFEVGFTGFGWWPVLLFLAALVQLNYWFMTGRFRWPKAAPAKTLPAGRSEEPSVEQGPAHQPFNRNRPAGVRRG